MEKLTKEQMKLIIGGDATLEGSDNCDRKCKASSDCCTGWECTGCPDLGYGCTKKP